MKAIEMTGMRFGRLTVIGRAPAIPGRKETRWRCICDCGSTSECRGSHLRDGRIKSCGCLGRENSIKAKLKHGDAVKTAKSRLYGVWNNMKNRCYNPKVPCYKSYGARGITVCDEWRYDYSTFKKWCLENGYDETAEYQQCTIDRKDNDKGYSPDNCKFSNTKEQALNKRPRKSMKVEQYDPSGELIAIWPSCKFIERTTEKYNRHTVSAACRGYRKTAYGFAWRYLSG